MLDQTGGRGRKSPVSSNMAKTQLRGAETEKQALSSVMLPFGVYRQETNHLLCLLDSRTYCSKCRSNYI